MACVSFCLASVRNVMALSCKFNSGLVFVLNY